MDSGLTIVFLPLMFLGGLLISFVARLLIHNSAGAAALGALLPSTGFVGVALIASSGASALDAQVATGLALVWTVGSVTALVGALGGIWLGARAKRRNEF